MYGTIVVHPLLLFVLYGSCAMAGWYDDVTALLCRWLRVFLITNDVFVYVVPATFEG